VAPPRGAAAAMFVLFATGFFSNRRFDKKKRQKSCIFTHAAAGASERRRRSHPIKGHAGRYLGAWRAAGRPRAEFIDGLRFLALRNDFSLKTARALFGPFRAARAPQRP
jgi:hypothetical protein